MMAPSGRVSNDDPDRSIRHRRATNTLTLVAETERLG
jgi:hypothetical protein